MIGQYILYLLLAVVVLLFMVLVHEFGHYCIGRMLGFKITEFSVGFGKALFSRKNKRGELISLRLFPLGGYCALAGEDETNPNDPEAFTNQAPWKRILVFLAGVTFNFVTAIIFSMILLCTVGYDIPQFKEYSTDTSKITGYIDGTMYTRMDEFSEDQLLKPNDIIISINGQTIDFAYGANYNDIVEDYKNQLIEKLDDVRNKKGDEKAFFEQFPLLTAKVKRNGEYQDVYMGFHQVQVQAMGTNNKPLVDKDNNPIYQYKYFWSFNVKAYVHTFAEALQRAVPFSFGLAWIVLKSLWLLITFQLPISAIGGPITTITTIATVTQANSLNLLLLIPLISANLAVFNLLPIPALDGSHVVFTTIEAIRKKPIKRETENMIHTIGLIILFGAVILIDILHFVL